jgi:hypothetical protein
LLRAFGTAKNRTPPSLQCIRYDDCKKWDAIPGSIHELERDDIWLAPSQYKLQQTPEELAGDDGEHQAQVRSMLLRLSSRGMRIDDPLDAATPAVAVPAASDTANQ